MSYRFEAYNFAFINYVDAIEQQCLLITSIKDERAKDNYDERLTTTFNMNIRLNIH